MALQKKRVLLDTRHSALSRASCRHAIGPAHAARWDVPRAVERKCERPMIIPMTTTPRAQQRYDHRLRDLVRCENSAEDGSPNNRVSTPSRRLVPREPRPDLRAYRALRSASFLTPYPCLIVSQLILRKSGRRHRDRAS
jgi:hypothetical protein